MDAPIDFASRKEKHATKDHHTASQTLAQGVPHLVLNIWYDDDKDILVRQLVARREVPSDTGDDLVKVYYKIVEAAGQLAADLALGERLGGPPIEDAWKVEPIMGITWTRDGYIMTCYDDFLDDARKDRWLSFAFMLGRTWKTLKFMLRKSFAVLKRA